jgi:hypothetical protein
MEVAFQLGVHGILDDLKPTVLQNVEDSTRAVDPTLSKEEIWNSVYQINNFHVGGLAEEVMVTLARVGRRFMGTQ